MRYLLFLLLLTGCTTQRLIIREETDNEILVKVAGRDKWIRISKAAPYQDYRQDPGLVIQAPPLAAGDLVIYNKKKHRFEARLFSLTFDCCGRKHEVWQEFGYPDMRIPPPPDKCQCK